MGYKIFIVVQYTIFFLISCHGDGKIGENPSETKPLFKLTYIRDAQVIYPSLVNVNLYALATAPIDAVYIAESSLPNAGLGVFAARSITPFSYFGPYGGSRRNTHHVEEISDYAWRVPDESGNIMYWIDAEEPNKSNWLRFVNCPNILSQENLLSFVRNGDIFYLSTRNISVGEELLVYYGIDYARKLGIDTTQFL